jgi:large subunit ribosomal protein L10
VAITKAKKVDILAKLNEVKTSSEAVVFIHFKGLNLGDTTAMRKALREAGVGYFVAKKTLMQRAFGEGYTGEMPTLDGEIAIAYSADPMAPAQNMKEFGTKYKDKVSIVGGIFQGVFKDQAEMTAIAAIPGLDVLRGMFAQLINSPRQRFAVVLSEVAKTKN